MAFKGATEREEYFDLLETMNRIKNIEHENLLKYAGSFNQDPDTLIIVAENAEKGSLLDLFEQSKDNHWERMKSFSKTQLLKFITETVSAVSHLHQNDIIHGAIRAKHILIDEDCRVKLKGIQSEKTRKKYNTDNVRYWAVELHKQNAVATKESDSWSIGVLMWEILTMGETPYKEVPLNQISAHVSLGKIQLKFDKNI